MTSAQEQTALRAELEGLLGQERTATLWSMLKDRDELATRIDVTLTRDELKGEIGLVRGEMAELRTELRGDMAELRTELKGDMAELRTELKGDMAELRTELRGEMAKLRAELKGEMNGLRSEMSKFVRTFIIAQVTSVFGAVGIVVGILRFL
ncbi:MAG TPA: hypothetical protein VE569_06490 [Acidimicrobiia bacterium]|jgi:hypothetical protein|nr:hypothetical protein [Acidimicrobiia bacterium]